MVPTLTPSLAAMDMLCCMGIGFFVAGVRVLLPMQGSAWRFAADFCAVLLALLLAQAYAAQSSNAGVLRFYMLCALALGAFVCYKVLVPYYLFLVGVAQCIVGFPLRIVFHKMVVPTFLNVKRCFCEQKKKIKLRQSQKTTQKQLQKRQVLLYNSNME